jgi:type IV secretory pathway VirB2 component (pilin)
MQVRVRIEVPQIPMQRAWKLFRYIGTSGLVFLLLPVAAHAQSGSPFDTGFTAIQTLFTGTIAKVASLVAIVIGGYGFAHGEPGAKKALAGVAAGTGIAVLAANVLTWLWGRMTAPFCHLPSTYPRLQRTSRGLCRNSRSKESAQIGSSRTCTNLSPISASNGRCFISCASEQLALSTYSIASSPASPSSLAGSPSVIG